MSQKRLFSFLRIAFGIVWGIDAAFKWTPSFLFGLSGSVSSMLPGQPVWASEWIHFWLGIINYAPHIFAILIAVAESALAIALVFNFLPKTVYVFGFIFSLLIWSVGEGFGGPYVAGVTDIGTAIMYAFVFAALYFQKFGSTMTFD
jgi:nitrite reductase (NO-forming)